MEVPASSQDEQVSRVELDTVWNSTYAAVWTACALDCEGSIGIHRVNRPQGCVFSTNVQFSSSNVNLLHQFISFVGGQACLTTNRKVRGQKVVFTARVKLSAMSQVLAACYPHLVAKRKQAYLVLAFRKLMTMIPTNRHEAFERMWQECKALNARGDGS